MFSLPSLCQVWSMISRLTEEKTSAIEQNQKLREELVQFIFLPFEVVMFMH